ncbi:LOW QUALITY PROTEIN: hypothetical protein HID58_074090, partial [Brassica napus]
CRQHHNLVTVKKIDGKFIVPFFFATPPPFSFFLLPLSFILLLSIYTDFPGDLATEMTGVRQAAGGEAKCSKLKRLVLEISRNKGPFLRFGSDLGVYGSSGKESVAASPGAFLTILRNLFRRFAIHWSVRVPLLCLLQRSSWRFTLSLDLVSLHSRSFGAFGSGELLLCADQQRILGCPVVKPLWRLESLTFVVALACFESSASPFSSSLPTWYVAGLCRFPTACFHTVKLMSLVRLAVVDSLRVGSVVCADAELGHLFRLMRLQPPCPRGPLIIRLL